MAKHLIAKNRARALSTALFLVGLAIILFLDAWWPGIMIVIGIPLSLKQFLQGRFHDAAISLFVFVGFFIIAQFNISWKILIPILFIMGAIYVLCKEWVSSSTGEDNEETSTIDIDDEDKK